MVPVPCVPVVPPGAPIFTILELIFSPPEKLLLPVNNTMAPLFVTEPVPLILLPKKKPSARAKISDPLLCDIAAAKIPTEAAVI